MSDDVGEPVRPIALRESSLAELRRRGVRVPEYDRSSLVPRIVHIGVGGFHRAHLAAYCHELAGLGADWGICGIGLLDGDRAMADVLGRQDHLYTLTTRHDDEVDTEVIGSIVEFALAVDTDDPAVERIGRPETAIVSLTVTEAGYADRPGNRRTFDVIAAGLDRRRLAGRPGVTVMSCDNMVGNGGVARRCVTDAAARRDPALADWVASHCTFPDSMVDRITPVTTDADRRLVAETIGVADDWPVVAEPFRQWVVQDDFAVGRPAFDRVGAVLADDVHAWELYKLRLLNAGHTAIAHLATLAGIEYVDEALSSPELRAFLTGFLLDESAPTLDPIAGAPPDEYVERVLERFANSGIRDRVARLCVDSAAKMSTFVMPILSDRVAAGGSIGHLAHVLAAWAHYLAVVPVAEQASDAGAEAARPLAVAALDDPARFVDERVGVPAHLVGDARVVGEFVGAHRALAAGVLPALRALGRAAGPG